jgi:hypothetical protein
MSDLLAERIHDMGVYNLFHCGVCGVPWEQHEPSCANHQRKAEILSVRPLVADRPEFRSVFESAYRNGFDKSLLSVKS